MVAVSWTEISVDQPVQRERLIGLTKISHSPPSICECMLDSLCDQFIAGWKVAVKAAMAKSSFLHEVREPDSIDATLSKSSCCLSDDALMTARLVFLGISHR